VYVAGLVRARTQDEFEFISKNYHPVLKIAVRHSPELRAATEKSIGKAGLALNNTLIYVADPGRWAVSMLQRVAEQILPTTNSLESIREQFNN
jgi:hypothetical protein